MQLWLAVLALCLGAQAIKVKVSDGSSTGSGSSYGSYESTYKYESYEQRREPEYNRFTSKAAEEHMLDKQRFGEVREPYGLDDDEVQSELNKLRDINCGQKYTCKIKLQRLTDKSFERFTQSHERVLVLFHLDMSTPSQHALITLDTAVQQTGYAHKVAQLACHDWTDVCQKLKVLQWPTMMIFEQGQQVGVYEGVWDTTAVSGFMERLFIGSPLVLRTVRDVETFIRGEISAFASKERVQRVTVGFFNALEDTEARTYVDVARTLRGKYVMGIATGDIARDAVRVLFPQRQLPLVVTVATGETGRDLMEPEFLCPKSTLENFVARTHSSGVLELTTATFPRIYRRNLPIVTLVGCPRSLPRLVPVFSTVARNLKDRLAFAYYNKETCPKMTAQLLKPFGVSASDVPLVIVSMPEKGESCVIRQVTDVNESTLGRSLEQCITGSLPTVRLPTHDWNSRLQLYDFLSQIYGDRPNAIFTENPQVSQTYGALRTEL